MEGVLQGALSLEQMVKGIVSPRTAGIHRPQVSLNNEASEHCTILEILAEDRLGFVYSVAQCLAQMNLNIAYAKLSTERNKVFDVFYLNDSTGHKLPEHRFPAVIASLEEALAKPGGVAAPRLETA